MIMSDDIGFVLPETREMLVIALDIVLKATALLAIAYALHIAVGRRRALLRSALWNTCLFGLLLIPVACLTFPRLRLPVLPTRQITSETPVQTVQTASMPEMAARQQPEMKNDRPIQAPGVPLVPLQFHGFEWNGPSNAAERVIQNTPESRRWRPDPVFVGLGLYLTAVSLILMRLGVSLSAIATMRRKCEPVDEPAWLAGLERAKSRLGIARSVRILASERISVPIAIGWLRPAIVLPRSLTGPAASGFVDAVLLHELAHIRRGDYGWNLVRRVVQALYWPHPLVWPLGRIIGEVREQACDDLCVHVLGGPDGYHDSLVEVAAGLVVRPEPALGMAMARSTALGRRIAWIHRTRGTSDCLLRWPARLAVAVAIISVAGVISSVELARAKAQSSENPDEPKVAKPDDSKQEAKPDVPAAFEVTVLAKDTGKPLNDASVEVYIDRKSEPMRTDAAGKIRVDLTNRLLLDSITFDIWADGYVQQRHRLTNYEIGPKPLPTSLTVELLPGEETLGGKVVDEQARPIAGVKVKIWGYLGEKKEPHELAFMVDTTTDEQGQWRCRSFRKMTWAHLYLSHPDYLSDDESNARPHGRTNPTDPPSPKEQPFQPLLDFTDVQVMTKGNRIEGRIVDMAGEPVSGAEVGCIRYESHPSLQLDVLKAVADPDGRFVLPNVRTGQAVLQIKAPGYAPVLKVVPSKEGAEPLAITLDRAQVMLGRVVDTKGEPISGSIIVIDTWNGFGGRGHYLKSDADGRFRWDDAPTDAVSISVSRLGFEGVSKLKVVPSAGEVIVKLRRAIFVYGAIRDAETGKKIKAKSKIDVGMKDPATGQITWKLESEMKTPSGEFPVSNFEGDFRARLDTEEFPEHRLRFRNKGYRSFETRDFRSDEVNVNYDVKLTPTTEPEGVAIKGVVRRPDGKPLEGAEVILVYDSYSKLDLRSVRVVDGAFQLFESQSVVKTDSEGRFTVISEEFGGERYAALVAVHPDFYADVPRTVFETENTIVAQPWGRIEGIARIEDRPKNGSKIYYILDGLLNPGVPDLFLSGETTTDVEGRFVFEKVPPGDIRVSRNYQESPKASRWFATTIIKVKPGETNRVELGGKGRPVIARIEKPAGFEPNTNSVITPQIRIQSDRPRIPTEINGARTDSSNERKLRWWNSPEGLEYRRNWRDIQPDSIKPDGTIRVEEVPPGDYRLDLTWYGQPTNSRNIEPGDIVHLTMKFTVPEIPGGYTAEPFDLGTLRPAPKPTLKVGQEVPPFDVETLDGKRLKLADLRGKYVLLDFWATWCGPCIEELPAMKDVYERFGKDDRFAMVSLSLDNEAEAPRKFVAENKLGWLQGFLGEWKEGGVPAAYYVESIPAMFLIGPDGKLIARGLRGAQVGSTVGQALKPR
jgi:beta-lactamase regulating signal transducer with metallopeptidase domain/peroxiredoxin/protocatechuate 3,4-dioxygenase beta subunit